MLDQLRALGFIAERVAHLHVRVTVLAAPGDRHDVIKVPVGWIDLLVADAAHPLVAPEHLTALNVFDELP